MNISQEDGRSIIYEDHEDWSTIETEIVDTRRWSIDYSGIFKHIPTQKFYRLYWSVGATEQQDESPFEYDNPDPIEVHQLEKTILVWKDV